MKGFPKGFLAALLLLITQFTFAQNKKEISGTVTDDDGQELPGVNITVEGEEGQGTQTDFDGEYQLEVEKGATLNYSFVGFQDQTAEVGNDDTIDIVMKEGESLEEVTVEVGYGSQKKIDNTSSITSISSEDITKTKASSNPTKALQGKTPGVEITSSDEPGSTPTATIRGMGTVLGGRDPLYVVDGMFTNNLNNINPSDIESMDVLKDASALAIYGNRAANGAIIVTTKSGKQELSVNYNGSVGIRNPLKKVSMANANEYAKYDNVARGNNAVLSEDQPRSTNWFDEITRTGIYHEHSVSISGASDKVDYLFSMSNYNEREFQEGGKYNRTTLRTNNKFDISDRFTLTQTLNMSYRKDTEMPNSAFTTAYKQAPVVPRRFENGRYGVPLINDEGVASPDGSSDINNVGNPLAEIEWHDEQEKRLRLQGGLKLDVDLDPLVGGLSFSSQFNGEYYNGKNYDFDNGKRVIGAESPSFDNQLTNLKEDSFDWVFSNFLNYDKTFGEHNIEATLGMESSDESGLNTIKYLREDINPNKDYWNLSGTNYADNTKTLNSIDENNRKTLSYFGRVQYKLKDRYLVNGTLRRDGSSQFSSGNKWGTFPSFGLGWILSKESFLENSDFVDNLKIRGGWGRLGNQNVPLNIPTFASGSNYHYSFGGEHNSTGRTVDQQIDPNLSWEITEEASAGIDFEFSDHRLAGSVDVYDKKTKNIILPSKPVATTGISNAGYSHMGQVSNKGFELALGWSDNIAGRDDFTYSLNLNYSYNKNKLDKIEGDIAPLTGGDIENGQYAKRFDSETVGHPLGSFWLWKTDGYDDEGHFKYKDTNDNGSTGEEDLDDREYMGSYIPKHHLGISLNFNYKDWDLSIDTYGAFGNKVYNGKKAQRFTSENVEAKIANDFWTPDHTDAANPAPFNDVPISSDYYLESGDFFRVNNITLGYTFEEPAGFISSLRLYFNATNPFIIQSFSGYTPELNADGDPYGETGVELNAYPALRSFVFGMNLKF